MTWKGALKTAGVVLLVAAVLFLFICGIKALIASGNRRDEQQCQNIGERVGATVRFENLSEGNTCYLEVRDDVWVAVDLYK